MSTCIQFYKKFAQDRNGATAIEYGVIAALLAVTIIGAVGMTGLDVENLYDSSVGEVENSITNSANNG